MILFSTSRSSAQIFSTIAGGNWNVGTTWVGGIVPTNGDPVIIQGGATVTVTTNTDIIANLTVQPGCTLRIVNVATASLSVDGTITVGGVLENNGRIDLLNPYAFTLTGTYIHYPRANVAADETIFENGIENFSPASTLIIEDWSNLSIPLGSITRVTGDFGNLILSVPSSGTYWDQDGVFGGAAGRIKGNFTVNEGEVMMDDGTGNSTIYTLNNVLLTGTSQVIWQAGANRALTINCINFTDNSTSLLTSKLKSICFGALTWNVTGTLTLAHKFFVIEGILSDAVSAVINVTGDFNISGDSVAILRQVSGNLNLTVNDNTNISGNPSYVRFMEGNTGTMTYATTNFTVSGGNNNVLVGSPPLLVPLPTAPVFINISGNLSATANSTTYFVNSDVNINRTEILVGGNYSSSAPAANIILANTNGNLLFDVTGNYTQTNGNFTGQQFAGNVKADSIIIGGFFLFNSPTTTNYFYANKGAGSVGGTTFRVLGNFTIQNSGLGNGEGVYGVYQANSFLDFYVGGNFLLTQGRFNGIYNGIGDLTSVVNGSFTQLDGSYRGILNVVSDQAGIASFTANSLVFNRGQFSVYFASSGLPLTATFNIINDCTISFFSVQDTFTCIGVEKIEPNQNEKKLAMTVGGNFSVGGANGTFISSKAKGNEFVNITGDVSISGGVNSFNSSLLLAVSNGHPVRLNVGGNFNVTGGNTFISARFDSIFCNINGNVTISNGILSLKGGAGFAVMNVKGGYNQTGGSFYIHNSTTIPNGEPTPARVFINSDKDNVGDFVQTGGFFYFDNNLNALSVMAELVVRSPNYSIGPGGSILCASNTKFGKTLFCIPGGTINFSRITGHVLQEVKQWIDTTTTLDVVSGNIQIGSFSATGSPSSDFLKVDGSSVLNLRGNKVFSNLQYAFSGILVLTGRIRTTHANGIFNNTSNAAFDATGTLDYYLSPLSTVEYYGVDNQIISGWGLGIAIKPQHQYGNLDINFQGTPDLEWVMPASLPNVTSVWVRNQLILTNGELNLDDDHVPLSGGKNIVIRTTGSSTVPPIVRTNGYIRAETGGDNGNVIWRYAQSAVIPVTIPFAFSSNAADYVPLTLTPVTNKFDSISVTTYRTNAANLPLPPGVAHVNDLGGANNSLQTVDRFWKIDATGTFTSVNVNFRCTASEQGAIVNPRSQKWIPASLGWALPVGAQANLAPNGTSANTQPANSGWWTLSALLSPLPVELVSFKAQCDQKDMEISWITASEINNELFTVERSIDGVDFEPIASLKGAGNSTSSHSYTIIDVQPLDGINYYRLKQTDTDGAFTYSEIITKTSCDLKGAVKIYSYVENNQNIQVVMETSIGEKATLVVTDLSGRVVYNKGITVNAGFNQFTIPAYGFSQGMYLVSLKGELNKHSDKLVLR
ncbi:MAG: T9SS type A sorting domain-containing protein [Bacteroidetes bacterium]|nr:T9SS type A sorting domain-containing protein [Bacteroidota bacterium]